MGRLRMRIVPFFVVVLLISSLAWGSDWPMVRHDAGRSGYQPTGGDISNPTVRWSLDLGGRYSSGRVLIDDVLGNGGKQIAVVVGGKVVLRNADNRIIWASPSLGITSILSMADFDRDGRRDLLTVRSTEPAGVFILDGRSGQKLWGFDAFDPAARDLPASQVLVADLDGDNHPDLLAGPSRYLGLHAFSFGDGYDLDTPVNNELWTYTQELYGNAVPYVAGDVDNNGSVEVVFFENYRMTVLNGADGTVLWQTDDAFFAYNQGLMAIANVDDDPQNEIVAIGNASAYNLSVSVFDAVDEQVQWQIQWYPPAGKYLVYADRSLADVDADDSLEIVVSVYNDIDDEYTTTDSEAGQVDGIAAADQWTTIVFDAATGVVEESIPNTKLHGVLDLTGDGTPELLLQQTSAGSPTAPAFGTLGAWQLREQAAVELWSIADAAVGNLLPEFVPEKDLNNRSLRIAAQDVDADGKRELYLWLDLNADGRAEALRVYNADLEEPTLAATAWEIPAGYTASLVTLGNEISGPGELYQTALATTDGLLRVLDNELSEVAAVRLGGFVTEPLVVDLDGTGASELLIATPNNELRAYDISQAGAGRAPEMLWSWQNTVAPILVSDDIDADGTSEVPVCDCSDPINPEVVLLDKDGDELWSYTFSGYGGAPMDYVFGRFNADATRDLLVVITDAREVADANLRLVAFSGSDGSLLWNVPTTSNRYLRFPLLVADVNADDIDDLIFVDSNAVEYYDGEDGTLLFAMSNTNWSLHHVLADFDDDSALELLTVNALANYGMSLFELHSETPVWTAAHQFNEEVGTRWPGLVALDGGFAVVKPNGLGELTAYDNDGSYLWAQKGQAVFVRNGALLASDPGGTNDLHGLNSCDINGDSQTELLFGSADGYLMAVAGEDATVAWAMAMGNPVDTPVAADVDDDGTVELLVSTYDGRLHLIDQAKLDAPAIVRDVAVGDNMQIEAPDVDIDVTGRGDVLAAAWDSVAQATGYSYSIINGQGDTIVPFADNGAATQVLLAASLVPDESYIFQVRAYDDNGLTSAVTASDGVTLSDSVSPLIEDFVGLPQVFNPVLGRVVFSADISDGVAVVGLLFEIRSASDQLLVAESRVLNTRAYQFSYEWDGIVDEAPAAEGSYTARLTISDFGGNEVSDSVTIAVDRQPPAAPQITAPVDGQTVGVGDIDFEGTAEALAFVVVRLAADDTVELCNSAADENGAWACSGNAELSDGEHAVIAIATDLAGNVSVESDPVGVVIDRSGPDAPVISDPEDGEIIKTSTFDIAGTSEAGAELVVYLVGSERVLCRPSADENGDFACTTEDPLDDGDYSLSALAADAVGNLSDAAQAVAFTIATGGLPDGDADGDVVDGDDEVADGDRIDGDATDGDIDSDDASDGDSDSDGELIGTEAEGCSGGGCQANGESSPAAVVLLGVALGFLLWRRRRFV